MMRKQKFGNNLNFKGGRVKILFYFSLIGSENLEYILTESKKLF